MKKRTMLRGVSATLAACMTAGLLIMTPAPASRAGAENATVQKYEDQIAALEQTQKDLKNKIAAAQKEAAETAEYKTYLDSLVYTIGQKISASEELLAELEARIEETQTAIEEQESAIADTDEKFKERLRMAHEEGTTSYLSLLLGADDVSDFLTRLERVNSMLEYDKTLKEEYQAQKEELEQQKASLESSISLQKKTLESLEADKADNEYLSAQAANYYITLENNVDSYQAQYEKAKKEEAALDAELTQYLKNLQAQNSSQVTAAGEFMWPLPVGQGYISCRFGGSDPNGAPHYAVDTAIAAGTPIYAANDGTVLKAEWHSSYGYYILIDHGNGRSTLYAHCSALLVSAGQTVSKGQTIGRVGTTGFSTGNHLHFEFRVNGSKVNPLNYLTAGV